MYSTSSVKELNTRTIFSIINEYDIFRYYVKNDFEVGVAINSPFRKDENPSFQVYRTMYGAYKLRYIDYATLEGGTCFDLVMKLFNCDFNTAQRIIDRDFNLNIYKSQVNVEVPQSYTRNDLLDIPYKRCIIEVGIRPWNGNKDKQYWSQFGIKCSTLIKFGVYPLTHFRLNGTSYDCRQLTYGYYYGNGMWKIYSPDNIRRYKWFSNTNSEVIQGWDQLPLTGNILVITKSLKDVILLHEMNIPSIAPQSEGVLINEVKIAELKTRFSRIYLNFDFDYTGIRSGNKYKRKYGIKTLYFTNGRFGTKDYGVKDLTDYVKLYGRDKLQELINTIE